MFTVDWTQHAVGHGGFHVGHAVVNGGEPFTWVYDCGARRSAQFNTFLKDWTKKQPPSIDWLFLSHFDSDHVSGLDELMSRIKVQNVMVPYVDTSELVVGLLWQIDRDRMDRWFVELVADPAAWLLARGADHVIFLRGGRPDGEAEPPRPERPERREDKWTSIIKPQAEPIPTDGLDPSMAPAGSVLATRTPCLVIAERDDCGLRLLPYREPMEFPAYQQLLERLHNIVEDGVTLAGRPGLGSLAYKVANHARKPSGRAELKNLFAQHAGSSNRSSLSLLSIPTPPNGGFDEYWRTRVHPDPFFWNGGAGIPAWVNTGDAELLDANALQRWRHNYLHELASVRVLALPHHGSDRNSDRLFQDLCPTALLVAHVKANSKKHPGALVMANAGSRLACITNEAATEVRMVYRHH
jgi:hypothetical protein